MEFTPIFFAGGLKCIDFCNTFDHLHTPPAYDFFTDGAAILKWGIAAGILTAGSQKNGPVDERIFGQALKVRPLIYKLLVPFTCFEEPSEPDLEAFNVVLQEISTWMKVVPTLDGYTLSCCVDAPLQKVLCEVVRSTADLLLANQPQRVKQCEECGWLFHDSTRNLSRRWCDMKSCGNKAKARRHYARVKQSKIVIA